MMEGRMEMHLHHPNLSPIKTPVAEKTNSTHQPESEEKKRFCCLCEKSCEQKVFGSPMSDGSDSIYQPESAEKRQKNTHCRRWSGLRPDPKDVDEEDRMRENYIRHLNQCRSEQAWSVEERKCLKYFENVVKAPTLENVNTILEINGKRLPEDAINKIYRKLQNCDQYLTFEFYQRKQLNMA